MIYLAVTDFSHLTTDELIKGIKALKLPDYIRSKAYGIDVRETLAQMTEMLMQLAYNQGMNPQEAKEWVSQLNNKVDKGNVTMSDLTQEVKEALTGGAVPVVGNNSVGTNNIINGTVVGRHLSEKYSFRGNITDADLDTLTDSGNYQVSGNLKNAPSNVLIGHLIVYSQPAGWTTQIISDINDVNRTYIRVFRSVNGEASGHRVWKQVFNQLYKGSVQNTHLNPYYTRKGTITEGDLNDIDEAGSYLIISGSGEIQNSPLNFSAHLIVFNAEGGWVTQIINDLLDVSHSYIRVFRVNVNGEITGNFEWTPLLQTKEIVSVGSDLLKDNHVVNFGDSIFGNTQGANSVSQAIANRTGATTYNIGFGGTRIAKHNVDFGPFSLYKLVDEIVKDDSDTTKWALQDDAIQRRKNGEISGMPSYFDTHLEDLKAIDFNNIDYITIAGGTNDFTAGVPLDNEENQKDTTTFGGALRYSLEKIMEKYKHLKILICSPMYRFWIEDGEFVEDSDTRPYISERTNNEQFLIDFVKKAQEVGEEYKVPVLDNYTKLGINKFNRQEYFPLNDGTHPNALGNKKLGHKIGSALISEF